MTTKAPSILDLAPAPFTIVEIERGKIAVFPLSVDQITDLMRRHPEVADAFAGGMTLDVRSIAVRFPEVAVQFALSATHADTDEEKAVVRSLAPGDLFDVILTAVEVSMPKGVQGFLDRFGARLPRAEMAPTKAPQVKAVTGDKILHPAAAAVKKSPSTSGSVASSTKSRKRATASKR
ncbi:hypothetical protein [Sulfitobacter guttiformis]|uniref:Uncharacterized protein n=1 Tax=Sulfitobacter guttiformis TaxID=74349 RepID=A0A420DHB0_9RHOB|nr:hypothetical protein [Sulfitobacter guttiformis]KIN72672.1 hypothetical protein Z949_1850 [Sulfitobacter guttiformis KCTC 32187]RKE93600.1 hypothetical protein C8N30_2677 [Sulfitobacter guttiformis]